MIESVEKIYHVISNEFDSYKMIKNSVTYSVPLDEANTDYQAIQEWAEIEGNNIIDNGA
jgi:hypothetical protein